ncbi:sugar phosphate isomerase/epimerase [Vicingaceae bacterium]|nr:sugar phosphate isomerase/epimerase [Vicingaceae bacterium]
MDRYSVSEFSTLGWTFEEDVVRYSSEGFTGIGVWRQKYSDFDEDSATRVLHAYGTSVSSLSWAGGFTGNENLSFEQAIDDSLDAIRTAATIDAGCLIIHPGSRRGHTASHARRLLIRALREIVPIADDFGVRLAIEPMDRHHASGFTFLHSIQDTLELLSPYPESTIGLVLDLFQFGHLFDQQTESLSQLANRIALVQLSDRTDQTPKASRCLPGLGIVDIKEWISFFERSGYRGFYEFEVHGRSIESISYVQRLRMLSNIASELLSPTSHAIESQE